MNAVLNSTMDTDSITRSVVINAPRARVWRALSNAYSRAVRVIEARVEDSQ